MGAWEVMLVVVAVGRRAVSKAGGEAERAAMAMGRAAVAMARVAAAKAERSGGARVWAAVVREGGVMVEAVKEVGGQMVEEAKREVE